MQYRKLPISLIKCLYKEKQYYYQGIMFLLVNKTRFYYGINIEVNNSIFNITLRYKNTVICFITYIHRAFKC